MVVADDEGEGEEEGEKEKANLPKSLAGISKGILTQLCES